jgi:hypothetical protein
MWIDDELRELRDESECILKIRCIYFILGNGNVERWRWDVSRFVSVTTSGYFRQ